MYNKSMNEVFDLDKARSKLFSVITPASSIVFLIASYIFYEMGEISITYVGIFAAIGYFIGNVIFWIQKDTNFASTWIIAISLLASSSLFFFDLETQQSGMLWFFNSLAYLFVFKTDLKYAIIGISTFISTIVMILLLNHFGIIVTVYTTLQYTVLLLSFSLVAFYTYIAYYFLNRTHKELLRTNKELLQSTKEAHNASEAKSQFLANMSHELRTPLNAVIGYVTLLEKGTLNTLQKEQLQIVSHASKHLMGVISDILDISKIENSKLALYIESVDIYKEVLELIDIFEVSAKNKSIQLQVEISEEFKTYFLRCDALRVKQIISNLLSNAIKFSREEGRIDITIDAISNRDDEVTCKVEVQDYGIGISEDKVDLIMEPFSQADISTCKEYGGTGLGLSISKSLLELMNSKLLVQSTLGEGSTFHFELTCKKEAFTLDEKEVGTKEKSILNVLMVEDNKTNQMFLKLLLEDEEHRVDIANDGNEGFSMRCENEYDVILMDLKMPHCGGVESAQKIREYESLNSKKSVPIIAVTANAFDDDKSECFDVGMNGFCSKPIDEEALFIEINKVLSD